jgi:cytochrome c-type biogenesis protein CcmH
MRRVMRLSQVVLVALVVVFTMGAGDSSRFEKLGHQVICTCGCNQILLECDHAGCPSLGEEREQLAAGLTRGDSDSLILQAFVAKYGPTVLAAPTTTGFNVVAWIMPFAVLLLGLAGTALLVRKWRLRTVAMPDVPSTPGFKAIRERVRRETDL